MTNIIVIIQARMGSTRLPGKVLKTLSDEIIVLELMLKRLSELPYRLVIATSDLPCDDAIVHFCADRRVEYFRGSEQDVLSRFYDCARTYNADVVVRLTADCPLVDPQLVEPMVAAFIQHGLDYMGNTTPPEKSRYPDGSDIEIFTFSALEQAHQQEKDLKRREHVTFQFWQENKYRSETYPNALDWSEYRYTVDNAEDLELLEIMWVSKISNHIFISTEEIIELIRREGLADLNQQYKPGDNW